MVYIVPKIAFFSFLYKTSFTDCGWQTDSHYILLVGQKGIDFLSGHWSPDKSASVSVGSLSIRMTSLQSFH